MITIKQRPQFHVILSVGLRSLFFLAGFLAPIVSYIQSPPKQMAWIELAVMAVLSTGFSLISGFMFFMFLDGIIGLLRGHYQIRTKGNTIQIHEKGKILKEKPYLIDLDSVETITYYKRRNIIKFKGKEYLTPKLYCNRFRAQKLFGYLGKYHPGIEEKTKTVE